MNKQYLFIFDEKDTQSIIKNQVNIDNSMLYDIFFDGDRLIKCTEKTPSDININNSSISTSVIIPEGIKHIEAEAFAGCESITNIYLPQSLESIGANAFSMCYNLSEIYIPEGVKYIGSCAFIVCRNLKKIVVDRKNISYSSLDGILYNKACTELIKCPCGIETKNIRIIDDVYKIDVDAFADCYNIETIEMSNNVEQLGTRVFGKCLNLKSIKLSEKLLNIASGMFMSCISLEEIHLPDRIRTIGSVAFACCDNLQSVFLPSALESIGENIFYACPNLKYISCPVKQNIELVDKISTQAPDAEICVG